MTRPDPADRAILMVVRAALADVSDFLSSHMATCADLATDDKHLSEARKVVYRLTEAQRSLDRITQAGSGG